MEQQIHSHMRVAWIMIRPSMENINRLLFLSEETGSRDWCLAACPTCTTCRADLRSQLRQQCVKLSCISNGSHVKAVPWKSARTEIERERSSAVPTSTFEKLSNLKWGQIVLLVTLDVTLKTSNLPSYLGHIPATRVSTFKRHLSV